MPFDAQAFVDELRRNLVFVENCLPQFEESLANRGFEVPLGLVEINEFELFDYANGQLLARRVLAELRKSLAMLQTLTAQSFALATATDQRVYDEIALRQRKLFEIIGVLVGFTQPEIVAAPAPYLLHYHLQCEIDALQRQSKDLMAYFGGPCETLLAQVQARMNRKMVIEEEWHVQPELVPSIGNEKANFEKAAPRASALELAAIGFGYQQVFGAASSEIHLNLSRLYEPGPDRVDFPARIDNLCLLIVSIALRLTMLHEQIAGGVVTAEMDGLRQEFSEAFPNSYAAAAIGRLDPDDIAVIFAFPEKFLGVVQGKHGGNGRSERQLLFDANDLTNDATVAIAKASEAQFCAQRAIAICGRQQVTRDDLAQARNYVQDAQNAIQRSNQRFADSQQRQQRIQQRAAQAAVAAQAPQQVQGVPPAPTAQQVNQVLTGANAASNAAQQARVQAQTLLQPALTACELASQYVSYHVAPLHNIGRVGCFTDLETAVCIKQPQLEGILLDAVAAGIITQDDIAHGDLYAFDAILRSPEGWARWIQPRMNEASMPMLYLVEKHLRRARMMNRERNA